MTKTVLIIDDDDALRKILTTGLHQHGFYVLTANSAEQGADILSRMIVDAIVLDRMMGGMDGLSFLKQLRKNGNLTPVIMLTALSGPDNAIDGLVNGANDYLAKPFQLKELVLRLNNIIKQAPDTSQTLPPGLIFTDDEFFITQPNMPTGRVFALSHEEKKLLTNLTTPIGNIVAASPMVAKRLRTKINSVLSGIDIITIRGRGYKLITTTATEKR